MDNATLIEQLAARQVLGRDAAAKLQGELSFIDKPVDEIIHDRRLANSDQVAQVKGEIIGVPWQKVNSDQITDDVLKLIPEETAVNYKLLPLVKTGEMLTVGMVHPDDVRAQDALRFIAQKQGVSLGIYVISLDDYDVIVRRYSPYQNEVEAAVQSLSQKIGETNKLSSAQRVVQLDEGVSVSEEAPIVKIVASTLQEAVDRKASDIHIEPQRSRVRVRFRLDGDLQEVATLPIALHQAILSRVKILAELKIDENRIPQDGRFRTILSGRDIDFRVSTFPTPVGEKVVLRILDPTVGLKGLKELGLSEYNTKIVNRGISRPFGMILISGPTGSGKTTTLYSLLQVLNKASVNIVSLEDPVEYFIDGLNQSQVRPEIGYNFAAGLRQILRQDPDVIMVGEIRDNETAELAVHAALTGHIVLSTIHTNNAVAVMPRLLDMGVQQFLLPSALSLMAAQRLVGKLCQDCRKEVKPSPEVVKIIEESLAELPEGFKNSFKAPYKTYKAEGCDKCKGKGRVGRIALFEVLEMTDQMSEVMSSGGLSMPKIKEEAKRQGMLTLRQDGILKALAGEVAIEDIIRETK